MSEQPTAPAEPPRQGLTYLRVMGLAYALKDDLPLAVTNDELMELFRAWLRLTDLDPLWTERALLNDAPREADPHHAQRGSDND